MTCLEEVCVLLVQVYKSESKKKALQTGMWWESEFVAQYITFRQD